MLFTDAALTLGSTFAVLQDGAKARGTEQTAAHARMLDQFIGVQMLRPDNVYAPYSGVSSTPKPCAYCGVSDFAHNQCNRCGAVRG